MDLFRFVVSVEHAGRRVVTAKHYGHFLDLLIEDLWQ